MTDLVVISNVVVYLHMTNVSIDVVVVTTHFSSFQLNFFDLG